VQVNQGKMPFPERGWQRNGDVHEKDGKVGFQTGTQVSAADWSEKAPPKKTLALQHANCVLLHGNVADATSRERAMTCTWGGFRKAAASTKPKQRGDNRVDREKAPPGRKSHNRKRGLHGEKKPEE